MVFDIVAGIVIGYAIIFLVKIFALILLGQQQADPAQMEQDDQYDDEEDESDRREALPTLYIDVKLEEIEGQWYGWAQFENGREMFVGQGPTKNEAIEACTDRLCVDPSYNYVVKYIQ